MTFAELQNIVGVLEAAGVPGSAVMRAGTVPLVVSPVVLDGPGTVYTLDSQGHWQVTPGNIALVTAVVLKV